MKKFWFMFSLPSLIFMKMQLFNVLFYIQVFNAELFHFLLFLFLTLYYLILLNISRHEPSKSKLVTFSVICFLFILAFNQNFPSEHSVFTDDKVLILQKESNGDITLLCSDNKILLSAFTEVFRNSYRERVLVGEKLYYNNDILTLRAFNFNTKRVISTHIDFKDKCESP